MKKKQQLSFEEWYKTLISFMPTKKVGKMGKENAPLWDRDLAEQDYNNGLTPAKSAQKFRKQELEDEVFPYDPDAPFLDDDDLFTSTPDYDD